MGDNLALPVVPNMTYDICSEAEDVEGNRVKIVIFHVNAINQSHDLQNNKIWPKRNFKKLPYGDSAMDMDKKRPETDFLYKDLSSFLLCCFIQLEFSASLQTI